MINLDEFSEFFKDGIPNDDTMRNINMLINNRPLDDFCNLSANEIHNMLYNLFQEGSIVKINKSIPDDILDKSPFFKFVEDLLHIINRENELKLTNRGYLKLNVLNELYSKNSIKLDDIESGFYKRLNEDYFSIFTAVRIVTTISKLAKKSKNNLLLTKNGKELIKKENRSKLFDVIFQTYVINYNWGYTDLYEEFFTIQRATGFTLYLLNLFGDSMNKTEFYFDKFLKAFPMLISESDEYENEYTSDSKSCYIWRTFDHFCEYFGLINIESEKRYTKDYSIKKSDIFDKIFTFDT